ncbi:hypothetical protein BDN72DRAFT_838978 [Pluteus cervinus]|uniref:Uncharacterized protein n=1 Tax=Pluteus cervinus TaxID=181527 RepID=A0ACD3AYM6_9AGAR|nr:hypothetical protein BDN72DRAFT_838978 [Pluteus cervinus]
MDPIALRGFNETKFETYVCVLGCPRARGRTMSMSEARRHNESAEHVSRIRDMSFTHVSSSPAQPSSPAHEPSSDFDHHPTTFQSSFTSNSSNLLHTIPGPRLEGDDPHQIYNDYDDLWASQYPQRPESDMGDQEYLLQEFYPTWHPSANSVGSDSDSDSYNMSEREESDLDDIIPEDNMFADEFGVGDNAVDILDGGIEDESDSDGSEETDEGDGWKDSDWWPWSKKEEALIDVMAAFPRSVFSETELDATRWFAMKCGVVNLPTIRQVKSHRPKLQAYCGVKPTLKKGSLGNLYTIIDLGRVLADEFANPLIRPFIKIFSTDSGECLTEASEANKWHHEVDANLAGPMVRHNEKDYFVNEPAIALIGGKCCGVLPSRWFLKDGEIWARVQHLKSHPSENSLLIDNRGESCEEIPLADFAACFLDLQTTYVYYGLSDPKRISGIVHSGEKWEDGALEIEPCEILSPNPYRTIAKGRRVLSVPLWFYCDDTSGNVSKKWNKHNSLLVTLAGLQHEHAHLLYNIHFLATSNTASPLEMFEAVIEFLRKAQQSGIEAYDCQLKEFVLLLPWLLAMLGDNPMQSEFASHIGLSGKCFCRVCHVRGADVKNRPTGTAGLEERVKDFLKAGEPRSKLDTLTALDNQLKDYLRGAPTTAGTKMTDTGVKDKYFMYFADKLEAACQDAKEYQKVNPSGTSSNYIAKTIEDLWKQMPDNLFSPSLRLDGFDPNSDTPVEILHVILLGFVKYFWRDAVSRQNQENKELLKARINSFNTCGLGLTKPRGSTLVQYAGSLTGRDFRLVLQLAPAVLIDLVPSEAYSAWLSLCRLAPLAFQPEISNLPHYLQCLQHAIDDFLASTALWNTQWFNKPKFHILIHMVDHIKRFGPAVLTATESFESYNFVIRTRSVHSNRQAPSMDIASSFNHMHIVRHLISGGWITHDHNGPLSEPRCAGDAILALTKDEMFVKLMGMTSLFPTNHAGKFIHKPKTSSQLWSETESAKNSVNTPTVQDTVSVRYCSKVILKNNDVLEEGGFVLYKSPHGGQVCVGRTIEMLSEAGSFFGVLVQPYEIGLATPPYHFPSLDKSLDAPIWCSLNACIASIGTFHNCAAQGCSLTRTREVQQERKPTGRFENEVLHTKNPNDLLLNLAQLRSAQHIQHLQPNSRISPDNPELVSIAVKHHLELEAEKDQPKRPVNTQKKKRKGGKRKATEAPVTGEDGERSSKRIRES